MQLHKYFTHRNLTYLQWYICRGTPCSDKQYILFFPEKNICGAWFSEGSHHTWELCVLAGWRHLHHCHLYLAPSTLLPKPKEKRWSQPIRGQMFPHGQGILVAGETRGFCIVFLKCVFFFLFFFFALTVIWNSLAYPSPCKLYPKAAVIALISLHANVTDIHSDVFTCMISAERERLHWTVLDSFVTLQRPLGFSCWCSRASPTKEITAISFYFVLQVHFFEYCPLMVLGGW